MAVRPGAPVEIQGVAGIDARIQFAGRRALMASDISSLKGAWGDEAKVLIQGIPSCSRRSGARWIVVPDRVGARCPFAAVSDAGHKAMGCGTVEQRGDQRQEYSR